MPDRATRVVLVGFMGSGKTSVGRALAARLGFRFVDLDARIEEAAGQRVAEIFREKGEPAFRELERSAAAEALREERVVIAAGGGAFADPATRDILRQGTFSVYLACDLDTILERVPKDGSRPLAGNRETMQALLSARESSYRQADLTLDASRRSPDAIAEEAARMLALPAPGERAPRR